MIAEAKLHSEIQLLGQNAECCGDAFSALAASWAPAWRSNRVAPSAALRQE
jgi:ABC-type lipoprotein release transport system permease subunit